MKRVLSVSLLAASLVGCATSGAPAGGVGVVDSSAFPDRKSVAAIAARPAPTPITRDVSAINTWTFTTPFATSFTDVPVATVAVDEQPIAAVVGAQRFSVAGRCAANELARAIATTGAIPDERFQRAVLGWCGSAAPPGRIAWTKQTSIAGADDASLRARGSASAAEGLGNDWRGDIGVGFARVGDVAVTVLVQLPIAARVQPTSRIAANGTVTISGTLVDVADAESIWGFVNRGDTAVGTCTRGPGALPQFSFTCPVATDDDSAAFELLVQRRGRLLGQGLAAGTIGVAQTPSSTWQAATWGSDVAVGDDVNVALLERTNGIRAGAGLPPLQFEHAQMATLAKLTPHYFGSDDDAGLQDRIALGAMAGWDLQSTVRDGRFSSVRHVSARLHELMGALLDSPSTRATLLDPIVGPAAFAAQRNGDEVALLLSTWVPYTPEPAAVVQQTIFNALKAERKRRGFTNGLGEVGMEDAVADASGRLQAGDEPQAVMQQLMGRTVDTMQRNFTGWTLITADPEHIPWPEELLTSRMTYVAVAAGTRVVPGNPWATTAVLIVAFVEPGLQASTTTTTAATLPAR